MNLNRKSACFLSLFDITETLFPLICIFPHKFVLKCIKTEKTLKKEAELSQGMTIASREVTLYYVNTCLGVL